MKDALLLVQGISILHLNSLQDAPDRDFRPLVRRIVTNVNLPEHRMGLDHSREVLLALKKTATWMCEQQDEDLQDGDSLLQRVKMDTEANESIYATLEGTFNSTSTNRKIQRMVNNLEKQIEDHFLEQEFGRTIRDISTTLMYRRDKLENIPTFAREIMARMEPFAVDTGTQDPAIISEVDFSDKKSVQKAYTGVKQMSNHVGILRTGWQGVNRMLQGGFRQSLETVFGALQHSYKSNFLRCLFAGIALFNVPVLINPDKKPMLLLVSFEDPTSQVMAFFFKYLYENETLQECTKEYIESLSEEYISDFVTDRMQATGFTIRVIGVDPNQWTAQKYMNYVTRLEAEGYEIKFHACDYLEKMPTTGCKQGAAGEDIHDLFGRLRGFHMKRGAHFFTPHQLSSEAKKLVRMGTTDFAKQVGGKGYWKGCTSIDQVVDIELIGHIEKVNGEAYYTLNCAKHRGISPPENPADLFCVYKIERIGELRYDVNGPDLSRQFAGGGTASSGNTTPFWETPAEQF